MRSWLNAVFQIISQSANQPNSQAANQPSS